MRAALLPALALVLAGAGPAPLPGDQIGPDGRSFSLSDAPSKAATLRSARWESNVIPVCWENPTPEGEPHRRLAREAVAATWETVANVRFSGWGACGADERAVRISVGSNEWPRAIVGRWALGARTGMWLNFDLESNAGFSGCRTHEARCEQFVAVHEFGHVLGFIHEQDRPDTEEACLRTRKPGEVRQHPPGELVLLGAYDPRSVMNYCSKDGFDPRVPLALTAADVAGVVTLFGAPAGGQAREGQPPPTTPATPTRPRAPKFVPD